LHHPDLILLDMHLPDTAGEDVLRALREEESTRQTPVVVVSADATAARQESMRALGADDYLTKPFNVREFLGIVDGYLN
jgi:DNA-binding response OmpR family regulator